MKQQQGIQFPAIYADGELYSCAKDVYVDCGEVRIIGEKTEKAWDALHEKFMCVTGFFIGYKGIEYGSIDMTEDQYFAACQTACCGTGGNAFKIHVRQFVRQFV